MDADKEHGPDAPGDALAMRALCAWNNVPYPNPTLAAHWDKCAEVTRDGWRRVAMALGVALIEEVSGTLDALATHADRSPDYQDVKDAAGHIVGRLRKP